MKRLYITVQSFFLAMGFETYYYKIKKYFKENGGAGYEQEITAGSAYFYFVYICGYGKSGRIQFFVFSLIVSLIFPVPRKLRHWRRQRLGNRRHETWGFLPCNHNRQWWWQQDRLLLFQV